MTDHPETQGPRGPLRRAVEALVDVSAARPFLVILISLLMIGIAQLYIRSRLELRSDFFELLPRDSPGFIAFERQLHRVGGGATLFVIVESPDRAANERFVDDLSVEVRKIGPDLVSYVEDGSKEVRAYFQANKWLYADIEDLRKAEQKLDNQIAIRSGMVEDLEGSDAKPAGGADAGAEHALGMDDYKKRWDERANKHDDFPTGYFATNDGTMLGIRIVSPTTGTGDRGGDLLLERVQKIVASLNLPARHPAMRVGYAGDIPNAIEEKESIVSEAATATVLATILILFGVFAYFRSFSAIVTMFFPVSVGIACAYSFATATFGYVNTSGAFLGAIIFGNGINYPIVLLSRYREFVARGMAPEVAKKAAVWNAFRAELVGASVAGIAYGSLVITRFRGFSQFGMIGFVGMLLVWLSIIPLVPATVTIFDRFRERPWYAPIARARDAVFYAPVLKHLFSDVKADGSRGEVVGMVANVTERYPRVILAVAALITVVTAVKLPGFLRDPWEYNFAHLGSKSTKAGGAGEWSTKAESVFGGKMNVAGALMLADKPEQTPAVKKQILENDAADPQGKLIAEISTVYDLLPGPVKEQEEKIEVLERIREHLTPRVLHGMSEEERKTLEEMKPPEDLKPVDAKDLPALLRRRFEERDGTLGTVFYVKTGSNVSRSNGRNLLRLAKTTDNVRLPDGTLVHTASRSTVFAEMIRSMERDGPLASGASLLAVSVVVLLATASLRGFVSVMLSLIMAVVWMVGLAAWSDMRLNFLNFIALPITFGIGSEYPFNIFDRSRLLNGDVTMAIKRSGGAVALCSFTTIIGYGALLWADNQALQSFGHLAMSGELLALGTAMFVLPSILHVWTRR